MFSRVAGTQPCCRLKHGSTETVFDSELCAELPCAAVLVLTTEVGIRGREGGREEMDANILDDLASAPVVSAGASTLAAR